MKYPFIKCESPRTITNKSTGEILKVGCGCCSACLSTLADKRALLCSVQEEDYKYCLFFTLTYSNGYLPTFKPVYDDDARGWKLFNKCSRLAGYDEILGFVPSQLVSRDYCFELLYNKAKLDHVLSYTSRRDIQLFMKRLRKYISYETNEKVSYYIVSEYGPQSFRSHYHGLLYFNREETLKACNKNLCKAWPFGRIDKSISRSQVSSYVAGYVNSTIALPKIFASRSTRPFSLHSTHFAKRFYQRKQKEIYEDVDNGTFKTTRVILSKELQVFPWRSFEYSFFPKIIGFSKLSSLQLFAAYKSYPLTVKFFGEGFTVEETASMINDALSLNLSGKFDKSSLSGEHRYIFDTFVSVFSDYIDKGSLSAIISILYCSKRFYRIIHKFNYSDDYFFNIILKYYKYKDSVNLKSWYNSQVDFLAEYNNISSLVYFYDNVTIGSNDITSRNFFDSFSSLDFLFDFKELPIYKKFVSENNINVQNKVKHKVLNDLNNIFL